MPTSQTIDKTGISICNGFALVTGLGANDSLITGFTKLLKTGMPELISGVVSIIISGLIVSALGIKLITLSIVNGQISLTATMPQRSTVIHFGAFLRSKRKSNTARTIQLADMLILTIVKKNSLILILPSDSGLSSAELHQSLQRRSSDVL